MKWPLVLSEDGAPRCIALNWHRMHLYGNGQLGGITVGVEQLDEQVMRGRSFIPEDL